MVDLGGGSCELTISSKGHIRETVSLPLGAVRLTNEFLHHDPPRKAELRRLRGFVEREIGRIADRISIAPQSRNCDFGDRSFPGRGLPWPYKTKGPRQPAFPGRRCAGSPKCWRANPSSNGQAAPGSGRDGQKS